MSFTLIDEGSGGNELTVNVWRWKPILEIVKNIDILDDSKIRQMGYNGVGVDISEDDAKIIGRKVEEEWLPKLSPKGRFFLNLSVTDTPDDGTFYREESEQWRNYSVDYNWLKDFADFCTRSKGFRVF